MQKQIEVKTEQGINLSQRIIMPTHRELLKSKQYNLPIVSLSPFAVFVKKMASTQRHNWIGNINVDKQAIQDICKDFGSYDFLINFQFKKQTDFNQNETDYFEQVQQIPELSYICMNEKSVNQTTQEFEQQLKGWKLRNAEKFVVPVIESATNEKVKKIAIMKREDIKRCAVIFRSFITEEDRANLSRILANLRIAKIYSIVFGVNPKKWSKTAVSMYLPPLQFEANAISSWIAWGGAKVPLELLCSDWIYRLSNFADSGLASYNGSGRKNFLTGNTSVAFNTALSQIDTVNQASLLAQSFVLIPEVQFKRLFN